MARAHRGLGCSTLLVCALASAAPSAAQTTKRVPPTFPTGIELIRLSVSVTEGQRYVAGLGQQSFEVLEDGVRQELSFFASDPLPLSVTLLIDCSASMEENLGAAQAAGIRFVRALGPRDLAQVAQFSDRMLVLQAFTSDQQQLEAAIRKTEAAGATALYTTLYVALKELAGHGTPEVPRRRAIVLLSDGADTASRVSDEQVMEQARAAEIGVYAIALRPEKSQDRRRESSSIQATHFLTVLARETGGRTFFAEAIHELDAIYGRVAEELRTQYTLGYVSSNSRRDGRWRRIVVRTPGRDGLQLRHKIGYLDPRS